MTPQEKLELAANILTRGKALTPDRFPKPDQATAQAWADALGKMFDSFPLGIWPEAVTLWAMELVGDRMITPKELKSAAYSVRDRWEGDPVKSKILREVRQAREQARDRQLADGSFAALRGYKPQRSESLPNPPRDVSQILKGIGKRVEK